MTSTRPADLFESPIDPATRPGRTGAVWMGDLPNGREVTVYPMLFGNGRICVGDPGYNVYDDFWCFDTVRQAVDAAAAWDGTTREPEGWIRHPGSGRRRPDGDSAREHTDY